MVDPSDPRDYIASLIWRYGVQRHLHTLIYWHTDLRCPLAFYEKDADTPVTEEVVGSIRQAVVDGFEQVGGIWTPKDDEIKPKAWVHLKNTSEWRELEL